MIRIVFMGTPDFAVPSLRALAETYTLAGVVTQPDRPAGRGRQVTEPPVKALARELGAPVIQPRRLSEPAALQQLADWAPDLIVVAAFGQILKPAVLSLPPRGCLNVHASLLPRHRGAAPVAAAILAGDTQTGITLMQMEAGLDTGPILAQLPEPIRPDDTTASLAARLAERGADILRARLPECLAGQLPPQIQDDSLATYAPQFTKDAGRLDFARSAEHLARQTRACSPWPGAFAVWAGQPLKILRARAIDGDGLAGEVQATPAGPAIACGTGALLLEEVQAPGKRPARAADFARGARDFIGGRLA